MSIINLTSSQLRKAADLKEQIEALETELSTLEGGSGSGMPSPFKAKRGRPAKIKPVTAIEPAKKGGMSAAGRARIAAAQKARWARFNAAKGKAPKAAKPAKKRKMSAAGRAAIIAGVKARWAKIRAAKKA